MALYAERVFPWMLDKLLAKLAPERARVVGRCSGRVLEIGCGSGANLPHYPDAVDQVIGLEPSAGMLRRARAVAAGRTAPGAPTVRLLQGSALTLPFADGSFDTVLFFLVLCTIPDPRRALAEAHRVLTPAGQLLFFEHVRSPDPELARWQGRINPAWRRFACGCNLNRDTAALLGSAGFVFDDLDQAYHPLLKPRLAGFVAQGRALKAG